jgi:hypothetical protein
MTDLTQFKFITYYSTKADFPKDAEAETDYKDHKFIISYKYSDNSGAEIKCENCNLKALVCKDSYTTYRFTVRSVSNFKNNKLSCNELMIKNLLE